MLSARVSTQPTLLSGVRTRLQSSIGPWAAGGGFLGGSGGAGSSSFGTERATQLSGNLGGCGRGGAPIFDGAGPFAFLRRGAGRTTAGVEIDAAALRGVSLCAMTSTLPFSGICQKLGDARFGSVCMLSDS